MNLGEKLQELGWSRSFLAYEIGVHRKTVDRWFAGGVVPVLVLKYLDLLISNNNVVEDIRLRLSSPIENKRIR